jgi:hypothetical protein
MDTVFLLLLPKKVRPQHASSQDESKSRAEPFIILFDPPLAAGFNLYFLRFPRSVFEVFYALTQRTAKAGKFAGSENKDDDG